MQLMVLKAHHESRNVMYVRARQHDRHIRVIHLSDLHRTSRATAQFRRHQCLLPILGGTI